MVYKVRKKSVSPKTQTPPFSNTLFLAPVQLRNLVLFIPATKKTNQFVVNQLVFFLSCDPMGSRTPIKGTGILHSIH